MRHYFLTTLTLILFWCPTAFGQNYNDCPIPDRLFTRVEQAAVFNGSLQEYFEKAFKDKFQNFTGSIQLQILIDTSGKACCMSITGNNSDISSLDIKALANQMTGWAAARQNSRAVNYAVSLQLNVRESVLTVRYLNEKQLVAQPVVNMNTSNHPDIIKDRKSKSTWKLWNFGNSVIPGDLARNVAMDTAGNIWCCTDNGIVKISDDDHWQVFNGLNTPALASKTNSTWTYGMAIDSNNNVWIITFNYVARYDGTQWVKYDSTNSPLKAVHKIYVDKNGVCWFCGYKSLIQFDGKKWTKYSLPGAELSFIVNGIYLDKHETLWLTSERGICKVADGKTQFFTTANSTIPKGITTAINGDSKGNIWAGVGGGDKNYLVKIDSSDNISAFPSGIIWNITIDGNANKIWLATYGKGLVCFDGKEFTQYDKTNSIVPNTVSDIVIDRHGDKWISTFGGLVFTNKR